MAQIGLIAMAARPFHAGHAGLIHIAAQECDVVHLYASISDRKRKGEMTISGEEMSMLWKDVIEPTLPTNVKISYGGSPVGNIWKELGAANEEKSENTFAIYSDPTDLANNFPDNLLTKYCGNLFQAGQIKLRDVQRTETVDVSGTEMRKYLASGDKERFMEKLPSNIDKEKMWDALKPKETEKTEESVRRMIRNVLTELVG